VMRCLRGKASPPWSRLVTRGQLHNNVVPDD
jgi:hypothetical protein